MAKEKKKSTFWKDFKAFITRGNVIDMAVGVIVGGAFGKISTGLVNYILNPVVGLFLKEGSLDSVKTVLIEEITDINGNVTQPEVAILWGTWLQTIIDFLLVALVLFCVLRTVMRAKARIDEGLHAEQLKKAAEAKAAEEAAAKEAAEKAEAEAARQAEAEAKAAAEKAEAEAAFRKSVIEQEALLKDIRDLLKAKN